MDSVYQFENQTVLDHGKSVWNWFKKLHKAMLNNDLNSLTDYKLPEWISQYRTELLDNLYDLKIIEEYCIYHDIGKPKCIEYDDEGKKHFPNHAWVSYKTYLEEFPNPNAIVASLILHDMDIHLLKNDGISKFLELPTKQVITHLLVGLAELHSNAQMFGGIESTSFKIKWKNINKRGKAILKTLFQN
jgi:CRISPR/Cas system-associated endonuclease Cas3-HD